MSNPAIRFLTAHDLPAYKALRDIGLKNDPDAFSSDFESEVHRPVESYAARVGQPPGNDFILGAFAPDGALLGAVVCVRETRLKTRHEASLAGMIVAPQARGQGVGKALLAEFDVQVRRIPGIQHVVLGVTASNAGAVRLYEGAGFVRYGLLPRAIKLADRYFDTALMVKTL
ncbi:MAG: N-acetyltransferase [Ottowia sp.]|uniref:GNAT family N-acetyltransferase n=1 Tax=Ottowia sp. TaxID=1898956 RepID=UPI003C745CB3